MYKYKVTSPGGREFICIAKNSTDAKRQACKFWGIRANNYWCGVLVLKAKKERM